MELSSRQMQKVDSQASSRYSIDVLQMMELAGAHVARFAAGLKPNKVVVLYGRGLNGGDGLVCARHLSIMGIPVEIIGTGKELAPAAEKQRACLREMGMHAAKRIEASDADLIIDALLGSSIKGPPREEYVRLISEANQARHNGAEIISIDMPSGMDPDTGSEFSPCIQPDYVVFIGALKKAARKIKCKKYVVNVGIPGKAFEDVGVAYKEMFSVSDIIEIE